MRNIFLKFCSILIFVTLIYVDLLRLKVFKIISLFVDLYFRHAECDMIEGRKRNLIFIFATYISFVHFSAALFSLVLQEE